MAVKGSRSGKISSTLRSNNNDDDNDVNDDDKDMYI
jgi:hypothetical protein